MIKNLDQLLEKAKSISARRPHPVKVAVAGADDQAAVSALLEAGRMGLAEGLLIGDRATISPLLGPEPPDFLEILHEPDERKAAEMAVGAVREGRAGILLKGRAKTPTLLKAVLDPDKGLRTGRLLSDVFLFEDPRREGNKLVMITDGGVNPAPDLHQKIQILENAVQVAHLLGNPSPKVAVLSAVETVNPDLQSTVDAAIIAKMNQRGQIKGCIVDGPLALDNAVSEEAARLKGIDSPVAGRADILLCPSIEAANLLAKGILYFAGVRLAHVIMGAKAPVLIPSRADTPEAKLLSIALGIVVAAAS